MILEIAMVAIVGIFAVSKPIHDIAKRKQAEEKIMHLNNVLRAIRKVNQLITEEKDRDKLLKVVCENLIETRGYYTAWIALLDKQHKLITSAEAGLGKKFLPMVERLKRGEFTKCQEKVLEKPDLIIIDNPAVSCDDCPLSTSYYADKAAGAIQRLEHSGRVYGFISVSASPLVAKSKDEQLLFSEVANDISHALYAIEAEDERKRAEEALKQRTYELRVANIRLKELDHLKSMFIASMSHELRTPLNSIIGFTGIILQGMAGEITEEQRKQLTMVKNSANHLLALITDVIDVSKIEAGKVELAIEEFDLSILLQEVKDSITVAVEKKDLKMSLEMPEKLVIKSDERRVKQIIVNLISNAVKFTDEGEIEAKVTKKDNMVEVSVRDTGIGIRKEHMDRLFKAFSQIPVEGTPKESTGLGLYLSQKIADLLGGKITAESEFARGSEFTLTLPLKYK
ncbi:GAF domain-containing sensor histidine kinase, partial [Candidatus Sumerlaeota bacterium]|nr:GAF domain-containing sensor histidine kinase [Candidatus Sumerlaeota bacterium]